MPEALSINYNCYMDRQSGAFDIQTYMTRGVERVVADAVRATLKNPKESIFMAKFAAASRRASARRRAAEDKGEHIPAFLIASITSQCNLHCAGCYSRCNNATTDDSPVNLLTKDDWNKIFNEANELGISFILLAGGEPMLRHDVIEAAGNIPDILFPVFTNGTFMNGRYLDLLDEHRNLIPIISLEGDREVTDRRRGDGVYDKLVTAMDRLNGRGIIFGASVTVTAENLNDVLSDRFVSDLSARGCKAVIYVEYVPVEEESIDLAPGDKEREVIEGRISDLRRDYQQMLFISFPGDEKSSGGCVAAGRGFFHINAYGSAEPCPFSPYSDINVKDTSLKDALNSKFFRALRDDGYLLDEHRGGCTLYTKRAQVEKLIADNDGNRMI